MMETLALRNLNIKWLEKPSVSFLMVTSPSCMSSLWEPRTAPALPTTLSTLTWLGTRRAKYLVSRHENCLKISLRLIQPGIACNHVSEVTTN